MGHFLSTVVLAVGLATGGGAFAAEITLIAPTGARAAVEALIPGFQAKSGNTVKATFGSGGGTHAQVVKGDPFDVPIVQPPYTDVLASGNVDPMSETPLATVAVGVAVRTGQPHPDISTADAVKRLLLEAKSISYPNGAGGAAAGVSFDATLQKLGIADQMKPKIKIAQGGSAAMQMLAKGDVDIGLTFISEILPEPGVELVGPLPKDISPPTGLVAFVNARSKDAAAAKALIQFLSAPEAATVYRSKGLEPATK